MNSIEYHIEDEAMYHACSLMRDLADLGSSACNDLTLRSQVVNSAIAQIDALLESKTGPLGDETLSIWRLQLQNESDGIELALVA
ncbi:MAG: hypothetical protein JW841_02750 [Deltaproteobacteria bacterium]|nr:hypothetical protein [Deltaproteobacteria bacterium]